MTIYEKHIKLQNEHIEFLKQFKEQEDVINELKKHDRTAGNNDW